MRKFSRRDFTKNISMGVGAYGFHCLPLIKDAGIGKRIGLIGLDSSHAITFTKVINDPLASPDYLGYKVVAAYPKGSIDIESSVSRIPAYTEEIRKMGVEITVSLEELIRKVDVLFLITNDGRRHLEQALEVFRSGKRMFIDKPLAASLKDGLDIFKASNFYQVPFFSCSSLRFNKINDELAPIGEIYGAETYSPADIEKTHPDLFWYAIHGIENLCSIMGTGCSHVSRISSRDTDIVVGNWSDGRMGIYRGLRQKHYYGGIVFGEKGVLTFQRQEVHNGVNILYKKIIDFFNTGEVPVKKEQTLEILAFMEAADESKYHDGKPVPLAFVMDRAEHSKKRLRL